MSGNAAPLRDIKGVHMQNLHLNDNLPPKPDTPGTTVIYNTPAPTGGLKFALLFGAVAALAGAAWYGYTEIQKLKTELAQTREILASEIGKVNEASSSGVQSARAVIRSLESQLAQARRQSEQAVGEAKLDASKQADLLAKKLTLAQEAQAAQAAKIAESVTAVNAAVAATKEESKASVAAVSTEVASVKSQADSTKAELERTISDLTSTRGDLGIQSGLIATNSRELSALRARGERVYTEFRIAKSKEPQRVGDFQIRLTKADAKKNRYTVEVTFDDKKVEKKDRTANEPVQFMMPKTSTPYELIVNEVRKDLIVGYVSAPRVRN
jgi:hypothetical protein